MYMHILLYFQHIMNIFFDSPNGTYLIMAQSFKFPMPVTCNASMQLSYSTNGVQLYITLTPHSLMTMGEHFTV